MIAERLMEIREELEALYRQRISEKQASPGLVEAIHRLEWKQENFKIAENLWKNMRR